MAALFVALTVAASIPPPLAQGTPAGPDPAPADTSPGARGGCQPSCACAAGQSYSGALAGLITHEKREADRAMAAAASAAGPGFVAEAYLPCVFGWIRVGAQRCRIKVLLDSGATHCFVSPHLAARWPQACSQLLPSQPLCSKRATEGGFGVSLVLGGLD